MATTDVTVTRAAGPPPGLSRWSMMTMLPKMARDRLSVMSSVAARYGDAVTLPLGFSALHFFNHPDYAKYVLADNSANYHKGIGLIHAKRALGNGLLTSEGELWHKQRRTIQPAFAVKRLAGQVGAVVEEAERMVDRLATFQGRGPIDVREEMTALTLGVLGRALLDSDLGAFGSVGKSFEAVQDQAMFDMMSLGAVPTWLPLPKQARFRRARKDLQRVVDQLVVDRTARPSETGDDVLSRLIHSTAGESDPGVRAARMRDELVTLLLAGHETTASTLSWTFHLADENPEVWQRLHDEAVAVLGDRQPVFEDLNRLEYTSMVLNEVMRLYPPVWLLPRRALADDVVGGYFVPAGSDVLICPYTLHRHPAFWDQPAKFDPERFAPDRTNSRPRYAYIPFGAGPRFCVGNNLGMMEAAFMIAMVARRLRLRKTPGRVVTPEPMLTMRIRGGLPMTVHALS
jgi:cytochrome P450